MALEPTTTAALINTGGQIASMFSNPYGKWWKYQKKNMALQHQYEQQSAEAAHARQLALYNLQFNNELMTSHPKFQAERMMSAGFNPALMYSASQGGMGVSMPSASSGATPSGGTPLAPTLTEQMARVSEQALSWSLLRAQKENIEAQTEKTQSETAVNEITATGVLPAEIAVKNQSLAESLERIQDMQVRRDGQRLENQFMSIRNHIANATSESDINRIKNDAIYSSKQIEYLSEEIFRAERENKIGEETMKATIMKAFEELKNITIDTALKSAEIDLKKEQTKHTTEQIGLTVEQRNAITEQFNLEWFKLDLDTYIKKRGQDSTLFGTLREMITIITGNEWKEDFNRQPHLNHKGLQYDDQSNQYRSTHRYVPK